MSGSGFPPGSPLQAELFSDPVLLGTTTADAAGSFRLTVTVPLNTTPGAHTLRVSVVGGTLKAETTLTVAAPAAVQPRTQVLSRTGGAFARAARAAAALVVGGFFLVGLTWRRGLPEPAFGLRPRTSKRQSSGRRSSGRQWSKREWQWSRRQWAGARR